jgi:hypothetical protein
MLPENVLCIQCGFHRERGVDVSVKQEPLPTVEPAIGLRFAGLTYLATTVATVGLTAWFGRSEFRSPGMSFAVALMIIDLVVVVLGQRQALEANSRGIPREARALGWMALVFAVLACSYVGVFFLAWLPFFGVWLGLHVVLIAALLMAPAE